MTLMTSTGRLQGETATRVILRFTTASCIRLFSNLRRNAGKARVVT